MLFKKKKKIHDQNFPITFCQNPAIQILKNLKNRKLTISELEVRNFFFRLLLHYILIRDNIFVIKK